MRQIHPQQHKTIQHKTMPFFKKEEIKNETSDEEDDFVLVEDDFVIVQEPFEPFSI
jgi:hypothetical protein